MHDHYLGKATATVGALPTGAILTAVSMLFAAPAPEAYAANGQCRWEGGPGTAGGYAYCAVEDCIGAGGLAQCSAGAPSPATPWTDAQVGSEKWAFHMCDEAAAYMPRIARWCTSAGGQWVVVNGNPNCINLPDDILGGGGTITNSEDRAVEISDIWVGSSCPTPVVDTGWGATISSNWCWSGSTTTSLDIPVRELRRRTYTVGSECSSTSVITLMRNRAAKCPPGYKSRNATTGAQCYLPPECSQTCIGNPVSVVTGTKFHRESDYVIPAQTGIEFSRYYKSTGYYRPAYLPASNSSGSTALGEYWRHSYERRLLLTENNAEVMAVLQRPDGSLQVFDLMGAEVTNRVGSGARLQAMPGIGWDLTLSDGEVERYDSNGRLTSITRHGGQLTTLSYTDGKLTGVTGPFGHALIFQYNSYGLLSTATLPDEGIISYGYDGRQRLISVTYADAASKTYSYANSGNDWLLTSIIDETGESFATYTYDNAGRVISETRAAGANSHSFSYAATVGQPTTITDPLGTVTQIGFTPAAGMYRPSSYSNPCVSCRGFSTMTYDANGNPSTKTDFNGNQTVYTFDLNRNLEVSRTEAHGTPNARSITTQWHPTFRLPVQVDEPGRQTAYTYNGSGQPLTLTITDTATSASRTWTFTYNGLGQVTSVDGPRTDLNDVTTLTHHACSSGGACGQVATITDAVGNETFISSYDANGLPLTVSDANGTVTTLSYDARHRLISQTIGTQTTMIEYWPHGLPKKVTFPDGSFLSYEYDGAQRLTDIWDGAGNRIRFTLDAAGNRTSEVVYDAQGAVVRRRTRLFDGFGRLEEEIGAAGQTANYTYDGNGNLISELDEVGRLAEFEYDAFNRLGMVTDPLGQLTRFAYDAHDNLLTVIDPRTLTTSYEYNAFGEQILLTSPETGVTAYSRDAGGNASIVTDARNKSGTYTHDALGRPVSVVHADQTIQYIYDLGVNGRGRLVQMTDGSGTTQWTYDSLGRVLSRKQTVDSIELETSYDYNSVGQLGSLTTPSGQLIAYGYSNNRISGITINGLVLLGQVDYVPFGPTRGWQWGNGSQSMRQYDEDGRLTLLSSAGVSTYTYFADGSIRSRNDDFVANVGLVSGSTTFTISSSSNRLQAATGLMTRTYSYDAAGNTLADGARTFGYDASGRMVSATRSGMTTSYKYNGLGERVRKSNGAGTVYFAYDEAGRLIGEYDAAGELIQETVWLDDIPVATVRPDGSGGIEIFYVHTDHLNTPRRVTRPADNVIVWRWDSEPFGATNANEDPNGAGVPFVYHLRFPGQYYDDETGLHYNYFRDYDAATGRYMQSDPIGLEGGINPYLYANMNPLAYVDPYGLWAIGDPLPQSIVDFSAGLGDALLLGTGGYLRDLVGVDGGVDKCGDAYDYGSYAALAAGGGRLAYAGLAKGGSLLASSGAQASAFRESLKTVFRGGIGRNWRPPNLVGKTDAQLRASAGKTNVGVNAYGVGVATAAALGAGECGCER
jgi:RHS repeat-associated protein